MTYQHFDYHPRAGNRYYLNDAQRHFIIENTCEVCEGSGWTPEEIEEERKLMHSWNNKDLVEQVCGSGWLGFKGQTLEVIL